MSKGTRTTLIRLVLSILLVTSIFLYFKVANGQTLLRPFILNITPNEATVGQNITLSGQNFGVANNSSLVFTDIFSGDVATFDSTATSTWNDTTIIFQLHSNFLRNSRLYMVRVKSNGQLSNPYFYQTGRVRIFIPFISS